MPKIWIVQYLCPKRHAICASLYERPHQTASEVEAYLSNELQRLGVKTVCGICGSTDLHFEHRRTRFTDWDTAMTTARQSELDQMLTRAAIDAAKN